MKKLFKWVLYAALFVFGAAVFFSVSDTAKLGLGIGAAIGMIWTLHRQNQEAGQRIARMEQQLQELHNALVNNVRPYRGGDQC